MFKYISLFVCLLGVSLASGISGLKNSEVEELLQTIKEHREDFDLCGDVLGDKLKACGDLLDDLATLESDVTETISEGEDLYDQGLTIMTEFTKCGTESILKQITCYTKVEKLAKTLVATAVEEAQTQQSALTEDVTQLEDDLSSCATSGYTSHQLRSELAMCKLRSMLKN